MFGPLGDRERNSLMAVEGGSGDFNKKSRNSYFNFILQRVCSSSFFFVGRFARTWVVNYNSSVS
jgi:hypothetical protein